MGERMRRVALGLGNTLNTDEGVGVHCVTRLREPAWRAGGFEFLDGGTLGLNLLPIVEECSHLLILDAIDAGRKPGSIVEMRGVEIPLFTGVKLSSHQLTFQEVLGLALVRGRFPANLHLLGIQPADIGIGLGLSASVGASVPEVLARAKRVLASWNHVTESAGA